MVMRICTTLIVAIALAILDLPVQAQDEPKPLTGEEIRSQLAGRTFRGHFKPDEGEEDSASVRTYISSDGKVVMMIAEKTKPTAVFLGTFEIMEDRICVQDIKVMRNAILDRCYRAYGASKDGHWSGYLQDVQDPQHYIPLRGQFELDPAAFASLWSSWESIQKEAGPIDGFGSMEDIWSNPFRFKGKITGVTGTFKQMIGDGRAWFKPDNYYMDFIVENAANDLFRDQGQSALLIGEFTETFRMTIEGSDVFLPVMTLKSARACKESACKEYFVNW